MAEYQLKAFYNNVIHYNQIVIMEKTFSAKSGAGYFILGFSLIKKKGVKRFVVIPLLVNLILFFYAFSYLYDHLAYYLNEFQSYLPSWLEWLMIIIKPFAVIGIIFLFSFIFSAVANWLAAPFNGLLSEKVEYLLSGSIAPDTGVADIVKDIPRTLTREWQKLTYYIPRALGFFLIFLLLPVIGQIIWFLFIAWMMAIQYKDYPFDNHKIPFNEAKRVFADNKSLSYSFGITTTIFAMLPIVNLIVMPVAICGATALWVDHYKKDYNFN